MRIKWKVSTYRNDFNLRLIKTLVERYGEWNKIIQTASMSCGIPTVILYYLVGEHLEITPEIQKDIDDLKEFYNCEVEE